MSSELPKAYEPRDVEPRWYAFWLSHGVFRASVDPNDTRPTYTLMMPPPNVTGSLHMGHALTGTFEDVLVRHKRMQGYNVLWQPGIDHAGIATQTVVERKLRREGVSRHDLGRERFVEQVWLWKAESGGRIARQQHVLGCSADWERSKFTMDPDLSAAVREAFVRLYEDGLIYRATRLINWCSECRTALSDLEVESEESNGELYEFAYLVSESDAGDGATELVIATTRPETMLGDTAVAVHPDDPRYRHLHGKKLKHPFVNREIPIITDPELVDMSFGTGAVKVTPAHDFNDFATGKRHALEEINILNQDGTLNAEGGPFAGMTVPDARRAVKRALEEKGLARGSKPHVIQLPRCQRSRTVIEPFISTQWFMKMAPLAEPALAAVRDGRTQIIPEEWTKTYDHFLTNIEDWCISRQLWWGHRIPALHCDACGKITVTRDDAASACGHCGTEGARRDPDVLDTWFSSGLWPFSTLGWPNKTLPLERFYPTSDLETGYDILFFWVARMMMMGMKLMGQVPFRRVLLHGLVVDETGDKMSKVKGNTLDPLDLIHGADFEAVVQKALPDAPAAEALTKFRKAYPSTAQMGKGFSACGADALRFTLCSYSPQARRIALSPGRIDGYRKFCNKLYNSVRFALPYLEGYAPSEATPEDPALLMNRWVLSRLGAAVTQSSRGIEEFRLDESSSALYHFVWDEFCDWYIELVKLVFQSGSAAEQAETRDTLGHVLETILRALHPFVPFISEELWQRLPRPASRPVSLALCPYPTLADGPHSAEGEREMQLLMGAISAARTIRSEHEVERTARIPLELRATAGVKSVLEREARAIDFLAGTEGVVIAAPGGERARGTVTSVAGEVEVLVGLRGHVDPAKERDRLDRKLKKVERDVSVLEKRLANSNFVQSAPPEVVSEARAQLALLVRQRDQLTEALGRVDELA